MQISADELHKIREAQTVEFKKSLSLQKEAFQALCAMLNSDDAIGVVFFGVSDDGTITGVEPGNLDSAQKTLAQHAREKFDPPIICDISVLECEGKYIVRFKAVRSRDVAYHEYDGRAYIREGSTKRQLSYTEKQQLLKKRDRDHHNGPWICNRCGLNVEMLIRTSKDAGGKKTYDCSCGGEFWPAN